MRILERPRCGAPRGGAPAAGETAACPHRGTRRAGPPRPATRKIVVDLRGIDPGRGPRPCLPLAVGVPLGGLAIGLGAALLAGTETPAMAALADLGPRGRRALQVAPPPRGFAAFDESEPRVRAADGRRSR